MTFYPYYVDRLRNPPSDRNGTSPEDSLGPDPATEDGASGCRDRRRAAGRSFTGWASHRRCDRTDWNRVFRANVGGALVSRSDDGSQQSMRMDRRIEYFRSDIRRFRRSQPKETAVGPMRSAAGNYRVHWAALPF